MVDNIPRKYKNIFYSERRIEVASFLFFVGRADKNWGSNAVCNIVTKYKYTIPKSVLVGKRDEGLYESTVSVFV